MSPEDDQYEIEFPEYEPTEDDLRSIEYEDFEFETTWYESYDWSDVISEHDYNDGDE